jgi:hypothetical protein
MGILRPKPVSTVFYLGSYLGSWLLGIVVMVLGIAGIIGGAAAADKGHEDAKIFIIVGSLLVAVSFGLFIYAVIVLMMLYYKMWDAIQDGYARTTPGVAIGFMFIPLFNFYWLFQAIWGYSKDYNAYLQRHQIAAMPLPENLFLIYCILAIVSVIPYLGALTGLAALVIFIILLVKICAAVNALASAPETVAPAAAQELPRENWRGM